MRAKHKHVTLMDGWLHLAASVAIQAVDDLRGDDPILAVDALLWWLDPAGGANFVEMLTDAEQLTPDELFLKLCEGSHGREN